MLHIFAFVIGGHPRPIQRHIDVQTKRYAFENTYVHTRRIQERPPRTLEFVVSQRRRRLLEKEKEEDEEEEEEGPCRFTDNSQS